MAIHQFGQLSIDMPISSLFPIEQEKEFAHVSELSVTNNSVRWFDENGNLTLTEYGTIQNFLRTEFSSFQNGTIRLYEDISNEITASPYFYLIDQNILLDLNGHKLSLFGNSSQIFIYSCQNGRLTAINGEIDIHESVAFSIGDGTLILSSGLTMECESMCSISKRPEGYDITNPCMVYVSKDSSIRFTSDQDPYGILIYTRTPFLSSVQTTELYNCSQVTSFQSPRQLIDEWGDYIPTISVDGAVEYTGENQSISFQLILTNGGAHRMPPKIHIGKNAVLKSANGIPIFMNTAGLVEIEGGRIEGGSGIVHRSGYLEIKEGSFPTIVAKANVDKNYNSGIGTGEGTSGMNLGHAIMLENVDNGYGKIAVIPGSKHFTQTQATICGGTYISRDNVPIASYQHKISEKAYAPGFLPRTEKFLYGGELSMEPTENQYQISSEGTQYSHPLNVDYGIIADGYEAFPIYEIREQNPERNN